jgi:hypothetical protein
MVMTFASSVAQANGWTARNCHLTSQDYALLETLRDKLAESQDPFADPKKMFEDKTPAAFPPTDVNYGISGILESWHIIAKEKQELSEFTLEQLLKTAEENPRFIDCKITLSNSIKKDLLRQRKISYEFASLYDGEISFLQFIGLAKVLMTTANGIAGISPLVTFEDLSNDQQEVVYYPLRDSLNLIIGSISQLAKAGVPWHEDIRVDSGIIVQDGIKMVATVSIVDRYPSVLKPPSFFIPANQKANLLFDDTVLNSVRFTSSSNTSVGTSVMHNVDPLSNFEIGKFKHEDSVAAHITDCMRNFHSDGSPVGPQLVSYFNRACRLTNDQIMILVPGKFIALPKLDWNQVSAKTMPKIPSPITTGMMTIGHPNLNVAYKRFLELTGHPSNFDNVLEGRLMIGSRQGFVTALKKEGFSLGESENLIEQLSSFSISQVSQTFAGDRRTLAAFMMNGPVPLQFAVSTLDYDEMTIVLGQSPSKVDVIGLHSFFSPVDPSIKQFGTALTPKQRTDITTHVSAFQSCLTQTDLIQKTFNVLNQSFDIGATDQASEMLSEIDKVVLYASRTMTSECQQVALKPIKDQVRAFRLELAKRK